MADSSRTEHYLRLSRRLIGPAQHITELPLVVADARGPFVRGVDGREILDFISGACTRNLGYDAPDVPARGGFPFPYAPGVAQLELASELVSLYPGSRDDVKLCFGVCGSEAVDAAIKYCRAFTGRSGILSFDGDYHGTTFGACTLTTMPGRMSRSFAPMLPECRSIPFCAENASARELERSLEALRRCGPERLAGVVFEPIQGDMGMLPMHPELLREVGEYARRYGFLTVADEVQLAFYRTGPFFSFENYPGFTPDLIVMGKSLGGGIPLSAVIGRAEILDVLRPGEHDFTLAGSSEACSRGLRLLRRVRELKAGGFIDRLIELMERELTALEAGYPELVAGFTGRGLARGLWLKARGRRDGREAAAFMVRRLYELGLFTQRLDGSWLRLEPQLNLEPGLLRHGFELIGRALADLRAAP